MAAHSLPLRFRRILGFTEFTAVAKFQLASVVVEIGLEWRKLFLQHLSALPFVLRQLIVLLKQAIHIDI